MTKSEKMTILECISAVAWADGSVSDAEKKEISKIVSGLGEIDNQEIEKILSQKKNVDSILNKIREFNTVIAGKLLCFCYRMAIVDNSIHKNELEVIKKIALQFWPPEELDNVLKWLRKTYEAEQLYFRLFLIPQSDT